MPVKSQRERESRVNHALVRYAQTQWRRQIDEFQKQENMFHLFLHVCLPLGLFFLARESLYNPLQKGFFSNVCTRR